MIVRSVGPVLHLIRQPDHAHLAFTVMAHAAPLRDHPRRDDILLAVREHDNGWAEVDESPLRDPSTGRLVDFVNTPVADRQAVWPRGIHRLAHHPWAAALVAHHAFTVYERYRADAAWATFFPEMAALRDGMIARAGGTLADLASDYPLLRIGDLISLVFCAGWREPQGFDHWTVSVAGSGIIVTPDVLQGTIVPVEVTARVLEDRVYSSNEELRAAYAAADTITLAGDVGGE